MTTQEQPKLIDQELLRRFENCEFAPGDFGHEAHVRVAWIYLQRLQLAEAIQCFSEGLKRLTQKFGAEDKYHETITWFYLILINQRMADPGTDDWEAFKSANPDILTSKPPLFAKHYSGETLASPLARKRFLLPDLGSA